MLLGHGQKNNYSSDSGCLAPEKVKYIFVNSSSAKAHGVSLITRDIFFFREAATLQEEYEISTMANLPDDVKLSVKFVQERFKVLKNAQDFRQLETKAVRFAVCFKRWVG